MYQHSIKTKTKTKARRFQQSHKTKRDHVTGKIERAINPTVTHNSLKSFRFRNGEAFRVYRADTFTQYARRVSPCIKKL